MTKIMDKMPNKEIVGRYIEYDGFCPWCESENITAGDFYCDVSIAWRDVFCNDCGAEWFDEYNLAQISFDLKNTQERVFMPNEEV